MKRKLSKTALSFVLSLAATSAFAHEPTTGPNGGLQVDAGAYHAELVADGSTKVALYLSDANGKPVPAAGFKASAIFIVDDNVMLNVARFAALCRAIIEAGFNDVHYLVQAMTSSIASWIASVLS